MARRKSQRGHIKQGEFIRLATKGDCSFIRRLSGDVFSVFGDYSEIIPQWFVNPDVITVIYFKNGHPVGFAMLYVLNGEILAIAVLPKYQRRGIGSALLNHIERIARQLGLSRLSLHTARENKLAHLFFQKAGFKVIGTQEDYYPKGQPALIISKGIGLLSCTR
jgi:ribosomal protein S18 acetylase RimI-like enzyme